jgi:hypothetical protein
MGEEKSFASPALINAKLELFARSFSIVLHSPTVLQSNEIDELRHIKHDFHVSSFSN